MYERYVTNTTHVGLVAPPEMIRVIDAAEANRNIDHGLLQDLLATVAYLAKRSLFLR